MSKCATTTTTVARGAAYSEMTLLALAGTDGIDYAATTARAEQAVTGWLPECGHYIMGLGEVHACLTHAGEVADALDDADVEGSSLRFIGDQLELDYVVYQATV